MACLVCSFMLKRADARSPAVAIANYPLGHSTTARAMAVLLGRLLEKAPPQVAVVGYDNAINHRLINHAFLGLLPEQALKDLPFFETLTYISWSKVIEDWPYRQGVGIDKRPAFGCDDWAHTAKNTVDKHSCLLA